MGSRGTTVMASGLVDWVAKVFSSRGLQAGALALWACEEGWMQVGGWRQSPMTQKAQEALNLWQALGVKEQEEWISKMARLMQERLRRRETAARYQHQHAFIRIFSELSLVNEHFILPPPISTLP